MTDLSLTRLREVSSGRIVRVETSQEITHPGFYLVDKGHIEAGYQTGLFALDNELRSIFYNVSE